MWEGHLSCWAPERGPGLRARVEAGGAPHRETALARGGTAGPAAWETVLRAPPPTAHTSSLQLGPASSQEGHGQDLAAASPGPRMSSPAHR